VTAQTFFIVSSGRSGTAMLQKALAANDGVDMHHEHAVREVQPMSVRRYLGLARYEEALETLRKTHVVDIEASAARHWGDSSNKLSWMIPELAQLLPEAKFVHLVRDGRKVCGSYFRKLGDECDDDHSVRELQAYYDNPLHTQPPPAEKKYWWPVPHRGDPLASPFRAFSQFQRICWHWAEVNRVISAALADLRPDRQLFVRLEDLRESPDTVAGLYDFLNLPYHDEAFEAFARPHNVNRPEDQLLDPQQTTQFNALASGMMTELGYAGRPEYVVNY
jgi:Sulfotransferase family